MDLKTKCIVKLENAINEAFEESGEKSVPNDFEVPIPISTCDMILNLLRCQDVREPLEDVVFFVGKASLNSIVYHVLCRRVTLDAMQKDPNIHFMLLKQFNGVMEQDTGTKTLDEQENENRAMLTGG